MLLLVQIFLSVFLIVIIYFVYSFQYWKKKGVPFVPPRIPWGNYTNVFERRMHFGEAVSKMYEEMKSQGHKFFGIYLFSSPCFIPIDPQYVRLVLAKDFQSFHNRNFYYNEKDDPISAHLLSLNGEKWKVLRAKLTPTFTTGKIKMLFQIFKECGIIMQKSLQQHCEEGTPFNAKEMFSSFGTDVIVNCAFGVEVDRVKKSEFSKHTRRALDFDTVRIVVMYLGAVFPEFCRKLGFRQVAKSAADFFIDVVRDTVKYREETNTVRDDFLQLLIDMKNRKIVGEKEFTIEEIAAQCFIFFLAGFETSATAMTFALYEIASSDSLYDRLVGEIDRVLQKYGGEITYEAIKEMTYLDQVVEETLRKHSPAYTVSRTCTEDYHLPDTDVVLEKGTQVLIPIRGLHMDPDYFPEPEKFDPERFNPERKSLIEAYTYLPFGEGPRKCIGRRFGYLETKTALIIALSKFRYKVNKKTIVPLEKNPKTLLYDATGGIWLDCYRK